VQDVGLGCREQLNRPRHLLDLGQSLDRGPSGLARPDLLERHAVLLAMVAEREEPVSPEGTRPSPDTFRPMRYPW
jgi:hypothetical protein